MICYVEKIVEAGDHVIFINHVREMIRDDSVSCELLIYFNRQYYSVDNRKI